MSKEAERELAAFLAALPAYQRKAFESGIPSLTQDELQQWTEWLVSPAGNFDALRQEYFRLLQAVPAKLKEYREREKREHLQYLVSPYLPSIPVGRPRLDELAEEAALLKRVGKSYAQIAGIWNHRHGLKPDDRGYATGGSIRKLFKRREARQSLPGQK